MVRARLDDQQWSKVEAVIEAQRGAGRRGTNDRSFINAAVLWWRRTGIPRRDLPDAFGPWKSVFNRFDRAEARRPRFTWSSTPSDCP